MRAVVGPAGNDHLRRAHHAVVQFVARLRRPSSRCRRARRPMAAAKWPGGNSGRTTSLSAGIGTHSLRLRSVCKLLFAPGGNRPADFPPRRPFRPPRWRGRCCRRTGSRSVSTGSAAYLRSSAISRDVRLRRFCISACKRSRRSPCAANSSAASGEATAESAWPMRSRSFLFPCRASPCCSWSDSELCVFE